MRINRPEGSPVAVEINTSCPNIQNAPADDFSKDHTQNSQTAWYVIGFLDVSLKVISSQRADTRIADGVSHDALHEGPGGDQLHPHESEFNIG